MSNLLSKSLELDILAAVEAAWNYAALPLDPDKIAELYSENACFYGGLAEHFVGRKSIANYFKYYDSILIGMKLGLENQIAMRLCADVLTYQGVGYFTFYLANGSITNNTLRTTLVLSHYNKDWKIVLHHFSPMPKDIPVPRN